MSGSTTRLLCWNVAALVRNASDRVPWAGIYLIYMIKRSTTTLSHRRSRAWPTSISSMGPLRNSCESSSSTLRASRWIFREKLVGLRWHACLSDLITNVRDSAMQCPFTLGNQAE